MAEVFVRKSVSLQTASSIIYTCPASTSAIVIGCRLSNTTAIDTSVNVKINDGTSTLRVCGIDTPLPVGSSLELVHGSKFVLSAGDQLIADTAADDDSALFLSVLEIS